jgi:DNA-binding transcriptional MocR family regulator
LPEWVKANQMNKKVLNQTEPLYRRIAAEIAEAIHSGALKYGDRLPSIRKLKEIKRVSIPTIQEALHVLEDQGLVEARQKSGYFVRFPPVRFGTPTGARVSGRPTIVDVMQLSARILNAAAKPDLLPFGAAVPSAELFPTDRLKNSLVSFLRKSSSSIGHYGFSPGSRALRTEVAKRAMLWDCQLDPEEIVITNGCVEAVGLALRAVTRPGDIVALESPGYYGFIQMLEMLHLRVLEIPSSVHEGISLPHLSQAIEQHNVKACVISTTVNNPSGATMSLEAKRSLVTMLSDREIPLIEDATFADLHFTGQTTAAKSFDKSGNVILCASLTKTIAPGLRIGWVHAGKHSQDVAQLKRISSIGQPQIIEGGLAEYLAEGGVDRHLRTLRRRLSELLDQHLQAIGHYLPASVGVCRPSGGFLLWLEWPKETDVLKLHTEALNIGIGLAPGLLFSASGQFLNHMRINCGQVWRPEVERGYQSLATLASKL